MGAIATFDYGAWVVRYPEFQTLARSQVEAFFAEATIYHSNDGSGPVNNAEHQKLLLGMLVAHIASLNVGINGESASPLVGRISSASEGSVSVSVDLPGIPGTAAWYGQSKYGLAYWQATAGYRIARYVPGPSRFFR